MLLQQRMQPAAFPHILTSQKAPHVHRYPLSVAAAAAAAAVTAATTASVAVAAGAIAAAAAAAADRGWGRQ